MSATDVVIVGAGVAGCSLACLLAEDGHDVTILEKNAVGGLLREIELETGYYCDSAPHLLFFDDETEQVVEELFSRFTALEHVECYAATHPTGDLAEPHHYPVTERNVDRWSDSDRIREELDDAPGKRDADTFEEYVLNQVGPTLYERYFEAYTAKHWGIDPDRITGDWFDFKLSFPETEQEFFGDGAYYPDDNYTDILTAMIDGCELVFEGATELVTDGDRIGGIRTETGDIVSGEWYVNTIDPSILVDTDESLTYRSMVILAAHLRAEERLFPAHVDWGYFPNHYQFTRITDYGFTRQDLPDDEYLLTVEFPCFMEEELWSRPEEWYAQYLLDALGEQGIDAEVRASAVRRAPRAYPLPVTEEIERFERINGELSVYENISNLGRTSTYEYIWIKDIVSQVQETATDIDAVLEE